MIEIKNLNLKYGRVSVFHNASVKFESGKIHGLVGLNGTGKTSLFRVLFKLRDKLSGSITYNHNNLNRSEMAFLPTENFFYTNLTGQEYLDIFPSALSKDLLREFETLFAVPIDKLIDSYSSGMKKKLALLGVLRLNKSIYLLDEPFSGLDIESVYLLKKIIKALKDNNKTILLSSHILDTLIGLCDHFFILDSGKIKEVEHGEDFERLRQKLDERYFSLINRFTSETNNN